MYIGLGTLYSICGAHNAIIKYKFCFRFPCYARFFFVMDVYGLKQKQKLNKHKKNIPLYILGTVKKTTKFHAKISVSFYA